MRRIRRGSSRYIFFLILILGCLAGLFFGIRALLGSFSFFKVERIEIAGNNNLEDEFLASLAGEFIGLNLFRIKADEVRQKFENISRVQKVKITRKIPDVLKIKFTERTGLFYLKSKEGDLFPIDGRKLVLENDILYPGENLPVIHTTISSEEVEVGMNVDDAVVNRVYGFYKKIHDSDPDFLSRISEFYLMDGDLYLTDLYKGYTILFGEKDIAEKYKRFSFLEKNREFNKGEIVDLRFKDKLIVRPEET
jgi:cell division septal protein FtsQ